MTRLYTCNSVWLFAPRPSPFNTSEMPSSSGVALEISQASGVFDVTSNMDEHGFFQTTHQGYHGVLLLWCLCSFSTSHLKLVVELPMKPLTLFCELGWPAMRSFFQERPSLNTWRHSLELADAVTWTKAIKASGKWNLAFGMLESLEKKRIQKDAGTQLSSVFFTGCVLILYLFLLKNPWPNVRCCHFFCTCFWVLGRMWFFAIQWSLVARKAPNGLMGFICWQHSKSALIWESGTNL